MYNKAPYYEDYIQVAESDPKREAKLQIEILHIDYRSLERKMKEEKTEEAEKELDMKQDEILAKLEEIGYKEVNDIRTIRFIPTINYKIDNEVPASIERVYQRSREAAIERLTITYKELIK